MRINLRSNKGISLTELMVTVTILIVVMTPVSLLFTSSYKNFFIEEDTVKAQEQARYAMETILTDLARHNSGNIQISPEGELVIVPGSLVYEMDGNEIKKKNPSELSEIIICTDVKDFKVKITSSLADPLVEIEIETQKGRGRKINLKNAYRIKTN
ncbi:MAG TPA: hypothetical protein GXX49_10585 [Clostridiaceae bacterium]|nr:hypothetical protein [Clostridiaceae bacterium]